MALSEAERGIIEWVIRYIDVSGAPNHPPVDQKVSDELARVFKTKCGFTCGCPGSFQEGLAESPYSTLLKVVLCVSDETSLSAADRTIIEWVIRYLEVSGAGDGHLDQTASDRLADVFHDVCGFVCGCPGTFQDGLRDSPVSTLLKVILCVDLATSLGTSIDDVEDFGDALGLLTPLLCGMGVLAATTITNTGPTVIDGDLGLSPGTSVTGFPPGLVLGESHVTDTEAAQAQLDLTAAYLDLEARLGATPVAGNIGGQTLSPGLYKSVGSLEVSSGELTLDGGGDADAVFIFQIASTLTVTAARQIILTGGAQAKNVYWQVGSSATLETTSIFKGSILALTSITVETGAIVDGRLLARNGAVTLDSNPVNPTC